ncbi:DUF2652 domain-containing protein [Arcticibacterium luteifluviistationis]|uniref:DUF2652 domain-containing protein n=1 Tax=Arcticibacterium luteifluviistationis TaxID=1784714 RepID=A0A2Z4GB55_9BACT|nr:DUF2652 domain-containing protein [Arcticibacterium luteifluviistationis]AWV98456.1 hypothetical protein DJ013_09845 [Arcticibacterium luteifluviistationis]
MSQNALLFIPDISGYTKFINHTDVEHSRHIVSELLEVLLDKNTLNLELAEIEGDALFLYKLQSTSTIEDVWAQAKKMFIAFHEHLLLYKHRRICDCGACLTASSLSLKFVVHLAPIDFIEVAGRKKPYGPEVVKVHRLLKNDIQNSEYLLLSNETTSALGLFSGSEKVKHYETKYDFGPYKYSAIDISPLRSEVSVIPKFEVTKSKVELLNFKIDIAASLDDVHEITSNFAYRHLWNKGVDSISYEKDKVNRAGSTHLCVINGNTVEFETLDTGQERRPLIYAERTKSAPFASQLDNFYVFTETETGTNIELTLFATFKKYRGWAKYLLRLFMKRNIHKSLIELKALAEETGLQKLQAQVNGYNE